MGAVVSKISSSTVSPSQDCSRFLNWKEEELQTQSEAAVVFLSLVANVKFQPAFDDSLEAKAVNFLISMNWDDEESTAVFLSSFGQTRDEYSSNFVQTFTTLVSSSNRAITAAAMEMLISVISNCSAKDRLSLVKADLIPQLTSTLNLLSLSPTEAVFFHICLMTILDDSLWHATPFGLIELGITDGDEEQAVHKMLFKQVLEPSKKYLCHLCVNRFSIGNDAQSMQFLTTLIRLLQICPYYPPTMDFVLHMPVFLTIPSCLSFCEYDESIFNFLLYVCHAQREWNKKGGNQRHMWETVHRMLRMEGIEDMMEEILQNDKNASWGKWIVTNSITGNNMLGMNLPALR
ncbi:hypothetical protein BLNAU_4127 [Blattamonas nauphoetae]|uniref:Uncharacterized protein n=1 Tax=Blattamonas nauphoetae TaxID=2049346 RepID=A0ABQ9YBH7_9EUKA|nr:hypothetical protein BLNAU_4127 [Blattamonas nauphoetae]